ncbi:MAG TPA: hypothetical protein VMZ92_20745, partial [Planctomycetota bacterium]|nr:hypothetical protein [Planctomycetota bacterium]
MRLLFYNEQDRRETAERSEVVAKIDAWWKAFGEKRTDIEALFARQAEWDLPEWMADHLQAISLMLMWEYGPAVKQDGHRLVITPEAEKHLRPLVDIILERAPQFPGWEFHPYRPPESIEMAQQTVESRTGGSLEGVRARARIGEFNLIDLTFVSPRCKSPE